jgi:CheY-like chemotaxis protein
MRRQRPQAPNPVELVTIHIEVEKQTRPSGPALKVLLLEDRDDFRGVLRDHLVSCSYHVISVSSGVEGLREIMKARFDLIICDMMMPRMGGEMFYWAATRVRPATRERFIFFTGHKNDPAIEFFFRRINARVLFKPFKLAALDSVIDDIIRKLG